MADAPDLMAELRRSFDAASADRERRSAVCPVCKRRVQTFVPRGGDGSVEVYTHHGAESGSQTACEGGWTTVDPEAYEQEARRG